MYNYTQQATHHAKFDLIRRRGWSGRIVSLPLFFVFLVFVFFDSPTSRAGRCIVTALRLVDVFCTNVQRRNDDHGNSYWQNITHCPNTSHGLLPIADEPSCCWWKTEDCQTKPYEIKKAGISHLQHIVIHLVMITCYSTSHRQPSTLTVFGSNQLRLRCNRLN